MIIEAITKKTMNIGNALLKLKPFVELPSFFASLALRYASTSVIGMIASVLVSLTVTALSRV